MAGNTVDKVLQIITPFAQELSVEIWDVTFKKEGSQWYLRVFIDKNGGISVDDCVDFTHAITNRLTRQTPFLSHICLRYRHRELKENSKKILILLNISARPL